jgi:hypothetical protein
VVENPFEGRMDELRAAGEENIQPVRKSPTRKKRKPGFVIMSADWLDALYRTPYVTGPTWAVAHRLTELFQLQKSRTVILSNGVLESRGVDRQSKRRALRRLVAMGLISVSNLDGQAPKVTWLVNPLG